MFLLPLREINLMGVFVTPAAPLMLLCMAAALGIHRATAGLDLNRYVWNRPLFEVAVFVALFSVAVLTLRTW
jgi:hypothetical protein